MSVMQKAAILRQLLNLELQYILLSCCLFQLIHSKKNYHTVVQRGNRQNGFKGVFVRYIKSGTG